MATFICSCMRLDLRLAETRFDARLRRLRHHSVRASVRTKNVIQPQWFGPSSGTRKPLPILQLSVDLRDLVDLAGMVVAHHGRFGDELPREHEPRRELVRTRDLSV
jgi:hypothetical protein